MEDFNMTVLKQISSLRPLLQSLATRQNISKSSHQCVKNFSVFALGQKALFIKPGHDTSINSQNLLEINRINIDQSRGYKAKSVLKKRCHDCYFVRRQERLFVECKTYPRHKQMKMTPKWNLYKEDYSKGKIREACFMGYKHQHFYMKGDNQFAKYDWLKDKIGKTI